MTKQRLLTKNLSISGAASLYDPIPQALDKRRLDLAAIRALRRPLSANRLHRDVVQRAFLATAFLTGVARREPVVSSVRPDAVEHALRLARRQRQRSTPKRYAMHLELPRWQFVAPLTSETSTVPKPSTIEEYVNAVLRQCLEGTADVLGDASLG